LLGSNAKAKKCRHRARGGNMSLDIPFNRTIRIVSAAIPLPDAWRSSLIDQPLPQQLAG
jgi:hypothetical protein